MVRAKLTPQQQLEKIIASEKKLAAKKALIKSKLADLRADSAGMKQLLDAVDNVVKLNNVKNQDVVRAVAKLKKTGLKFVKVQRKPADPNKPKKPRATKKLKKTLPP